MLEAGPAFCATASSADLLDTLSRPRTVEVGLHACAHSEVYVLAHGAPLPQPPGAGALPPS